ncbi:DUF2264 domain-containing protein [Mucisphaera calidilacus]|uniref:DUF2264 domain-containing protein n=1 Tax=Mucisphaera calidilacus TaxID=2527982 RepID=A0A518BX04_9BACT|nr:DUF2264 domain-containing protein [Mucisphaera calidilacus]QDU71507.1 hypothetical protein Pan265_13570 [Mucisphaera calidilacus]
MHEQTRSIPHNPLAGNPLRTHRDLQNAARDIFEPVLPFITPGRAGIRFDATGASYSNRGATMEAFARQFWSITPLIAGGGRFDHLDVIHEVLSNGVNPDHPEFWGDPTDIDQRIVEIGVLGACLLIAPESIYEPLPTKARADLERFMLKVNQCRVPENNWLYFRLLANLGLRHAGRPCDERQIAEDLARIDTMALGNGWLSDGLGRQCDWYVPWAMQYYGLVIARQAREINPEFCERAEKRARKFADHHQHWFASDGQGLPFGRSLTYKHAQASFWAAWAYSGQPQTPWGRVKGMLLRNLRWWSQQAIFNPAGLLVNGYAYPNTHMTEQYNAHGSPYWAGKAFLPLALSENHPFWTADEEPLPAPEQETVITQPEARMALRRDPDDGQVTAIVGQSHGRWLRHAGSKYAKLAYATRHGFCVPLSHDTIEFFAPDSTLALSEDGRGWRSRTDHDEIEMIDRRIVIRWHPWPDVTVTTWLAMTPPDYIRVHFIDTPRSLHAVDGGFAVPLAEETRPDPGNHTDTGEGHASVRGPINAAIIDLNGKRQGEIIKAAPNANLLYPRVLIPALQSHLNPGIHCLAAAVPMSNTARVEASHAARAEFDSIAAAEHAPAE